MAGERIAGLDHEVADNAVKAYAVVVVFADKFFEVVAMQRGVVVKADRDVAERCLDNE